MCSKFENDSAKFSMCFRIFRNTCKRHHIPNPNKHCLICLASRENHWKLAYIYIVWSAQYEDFHPSIILQSYKSWLQDGKSCAPRLSWTSIELSGSKPWQKWMNMTHLLVKEALVLDISHDFQPNHDWRTSVYSFCTFGCIFFDTLFRRCLTGFGSFVCPNGN